LVSTASGAVAGYAGSYLLAGRNVAGLEDALLATAPGVFSMAGDIVTGYVEALAP